MEGVFCHVKVCLHSFDAASLLVVWLAFENYLEIIGISYDNGAVHVAEDESGSVFDESVAEVGAVACILQLGLLA